jgi:hypothetical protein
MRKKPLPKGRKVPEKRSRAIPEFRFGALSGTVSARLSNLCSHRPAMRYRSLFPQAFSHLAAVEAAATIVLDDRREEIMR